MLHKLLTAFFASLLLLFSGSVDQAQGLPVSAQQARRGITYSGLAMPSQDLPADPIDAAIELARRIYGPDEQVAVDSTIELLRRSGIPTVSFDGPVIAVPDGLALVDAAVYSELVPGLTRATRRGDGYSPGQLAELLAGFGMGLRGRALPPEALMAALGKWGKTPGDPVEWRVAAAGVRALSGLRQQVLFEHADLDSLSFSPLQAYIILAHLLSKERSRAKTSQFLPAGNPLRIKSAFAQDPCAGFAELWEPEGPPALEIGTDLLKDKLFDVIGEVLSKRFSPEKPGLWAESLNQARENYEVAIKALSALILIYGAKIDLGAQPEALHFHHTDHNQAHSILEATASFDAGRLNINPQYISCYQLAGIEVPVPGPLPNYRVRWRIDQGRKGLVLGGGHVLRTEGRLLRQVRQDSGKLDLCGDCGEITGKDGISRLEVYTPTEDHPGQGALIKNSAAVVASLDKDDFPFESTDLSSFISSVDEPHKFAIRKSIELLISAIKRAGLPNAVKTLEVEYHGADIYVIPPTTRVVDVFIWKFPITVQAWSCTGLEGPWQGQGGFEIEASMLTEFLDYWQQKAFGFSYIKPPVGSSSFQDFTFSIPRSGFDHPIEIHKEFQLGGVVRQINTYPTDGEHINGPVGEFEVLWMGNPFSAAELDGVPIGGGDWVVPIVGVDELNVCPGGGSHFGNE